MTELGATHVLRHALRWTPAAAVIVVAAAIASSPAWLPASMDCTRTTIDTDRVLAASDRELQETADGSRELRCGAYRRRVEALTARLAAASTHPGLCLLSRGRGGADLGARLNASAELDVFKRLAAETCG